MYTMIRRNHPWMSMNPWGEGMENGGWVKGFRVDVKDTEKAYQLEAELPGVKEDQVSVQIENNVLTIAADLNTEKKEENRHYVYSERRSGHVERSFSLEGVDQKEITASMKQGILTVTLPKLEARREVDVRKIAISGEESLNPTEEPKNEQAQ